MYRTRGCIYDSNGNPMTGVTVTVKKSGTAVNASLYSDNGITTKSNGFTNDSDGTYEYYAPNGRYDEVFTKSGVTFTDSNSTDIVLFDPADHAAATVFRCDFLSMDNRTAGRFICDGHHFQTTGGVTRVVGTTTYRGGWIDVIETGAAAGSILLATDAPAIALNWCATTDVQFVDMRVEKVGDAVAGTRRVGLAGALLSSDPTDGIYIRQIDANNAFLICRASSTESTQDLGVTLNDPKRIRIQITTSVVRAYVDDVAITPISTNIPTAIMGLSAHGGATGSAAGLRLDYLNVYTGVRV